MPNNNVKPCIEEGAVSTVLVRGKGSRKQKLSGDLRALIEALEKELRDLHDRIDRIEEMVQKVSGENRT
jgi:uncharacterized protein YceH (UPF0502 family)